MWGGGGGGGGGEEIGDDPVTMQRLSRESRPVDWRSGGKIKILWTRL